MKSIHEEKAKSICCLIPLSLHLLMGKGEFQVIRMILFICRSSLLYMLKQMMPLGWKIPEKKHWNQVPSSHSRPHTFHLILELHLCPRRRDKAPLTWSKTYSQRKKSTCSKEESLLEMDSWMHGEEENGKKATPILYLGPLLTLNMLDGSKTT